jgi:hypothetical protein
MLFDLADRPRAWIEVSWPGLAPGDDDGLAQEIEHKIELKVEIVDRPEFKRLFPRMIGDEVSPEVDELDILMRLVSDWRQAGSKKKVLNKGKEVPFNRANCALLLRTPMFGNAFTTAYVGAVGGKAKLREGNSDGLQPGGQAVDGKAGTTTTPSPENVASSE